MTLYVNYAASVKADKKTLLMKCNFKAPVCHFYKGYFPCQSSLLLSEKPPPKKQKSYTDAVGTTAEYILNETYC